MNQKILYKVTFFNHSKIYELYAKHVFSSDMYGFISISELVFDTKQSIVIDPLEEKLREEFENIKVLHLPMQSIMRIEEVKKKLSCKIREIKKGENIASFAPMPNKSK